MLSWQNRKPEKTEYERLRDEYEKVFGKPWIERIGFSKPVDETIAEMKDCIKNKKEQVIPVYTNGIVY